MCRRYLCGNLCSSAEVSLQGTTGCEECRELTSSSCHLWYPLQHTYTPRPLSPQAASQWLATAGVLEPGHFCPMLLSSVLASTSQRTQSNTIPILWMRKLRWLTWLWSYNQDSNQYDSKAQALNWWFKEQRRKCADILCNVIQILVIIKSKVVPREEHHIRKLLQHLLAGWHSLDESFNLILPILWMTKLPPNPFTSKGSCYNQMKFFPSRKLANKHIMWVEHFANCKALCKYVGANG